MVCANLVEPLVVFGHRRGSLFCIRKYEFVEWIAKVFDKLAIDGKCQEPRVSEVHKFHVLFERILSKPRLHKYQIAGRRLCAVHVRVA